MSARYRFLPWVREGAATAVRTPDTLGAGVPGRGTLPLSLRVNQRTDVPVALRLYGPGDVTGFDTRIVVRTDPPHLTSGFEPNYFPAVELDVPALPWLVTPATGDTRGRLRPWLCLVVVRKQPGVTLTSRGGRALPVLGIRAPARPAAELPDLSESWAWAHAQVVSTGTEPVGELLGDPDTQVLSRLVCPRRLRPGESYLACLVPAFAAGRRSGLGEPPAPDATADEELEPAWRVADDPAAVELPVYFHWEFSTGPGGDFESLARRLQGRPVPDGVGSRMLRVGDAAFGLPDGGTLPLEGALRVPGADAGGPPPAAFVEALSALLDTADALREGGVADEPIVGPPIYGAWQAARRRIGDDPPMWLRAANLDPRRRAGAGLGVLVVQDQQEALMASAWDQLGAPGRERKRIGQKELARTVLGRVHQRMTALSPERFLRVTGPLHARVRLDRPHDVVSGAVDSGETAPRTVRAQVRGSTLPVAITSVSFRRATRPGGPVVRRAAAPGAAVGPSGRPGEPRPSTTGPTGAGTTTAATTPTLATAAATPAAAGRGGRPTTASARPDRLATRPGTLARPFTFAQHFGEVAIQPTEFVRPAMISATVDAAAIEQRIRQLVVLSTMLAESSLFNEAVRQVSGYLADVVGGGPPSRRPKLELDRLKLVMLQKMHPAETLPPQSVPAGTDGVGAADELRPPESRPSSLPAPSFPQPMYESLRDVAPDMLLPGIERIPPDTVSLLETNPAFIEAYMVGLNHEMSRELLWREYPSDLRATCFRRFWGGALDMPAIHMWEPGSELGSHFDTGGGDGWLVLLIRGELLQRYPRTVIRAIRAVDRRTPGTDARHPLFRAALTPDTTCLGFDLDAAEARGGGGDPGWFFVLEQPPGQPRFGLDASSATGRSPAELSSWNELAWGDMAATDEALEDLIHAPLRGSLAGHRMDGLEWGLNAGHAAGITLQRPVRVLLHGEDLLPPPEP